MTYEQELRTQICEIGRLVHQKDFVAANDGNISTRLSSNEILATPTGISKGMLKPDMLIKLDMEGNVLEGTLRPSTEVKMHLRAYKASPDIGGVVHAHPPYATAFAIAGVPLDKMLMPESVIAMGVIPIAPYGTPSTEEIPDAVEPFFTTKLAVLLESHGALSWGKDVMAAYFNMERLEYTAKVTYLAEQMKGARELPQHRIDELVALRSYYGVTIK